VLRAHLAGTLTRAVTDCSGHDLSQDQVELAVRCGIELHDIEQAACIV
jgi:hypothetical protein